MSQVVACPSRCERGVWRLEGLCRPNELPVMPTDLLADAERARVKTVCELPAAPDVERVYRYIEKAEPAVSGQNGHGKFFGLCCRTLRTFPGLSYNAFVQAMTQYSARCLPPWSPKEIEHKCQDAWQKVRESL